MTLLRTTLLRASTSRRLRRWCSERAFARRAVHRFMPGETADAALAAARRQQEDGLGTVLTLLGENLPGVAAADAVAREYAALLDRIAADGLDAEISVKPTQLGLDHDADVAARHIEGLAAQSGREGRTVWIDMEGSAYTDATLELFRSLRANRSNVGLCLQANLRRTAADLEALLPLEPSIRLVKGAYLEPADLAFTQKAEVDRSYAELAERLVELQARASSARAVFATHDAAMLDRIRASAARVGAEGHELHLLYGIRPALQRQLAAQGQRVRCLISYGPEWFPWYMRRLAERPANLIFIAKSLLPG